MDKRCPRNLKDYPKNPCKLAILRLKAIKYSDRVLSEEEENILPGCCWAVMSQTHNYCFFSFIKENDGVVKNSSEISSLLLTPPSIIDRIEYIASQKIKKVQF